MSKFRRVICAFELLHKHQKAQNEDLHKSKFVCQSGH